jgi:polyribonucleotide nucleotidyltransferase
MVGGIAMGLLVDSSKTSHVLTDILGEEDGFGLMDFKVTGTDNGIMAFQLDIKDKVGLTKELLGTALNQARNARLHILGEMRKTLDKPREAISSLAPQIFSLKVPQDKIGAIIGPAGSIIKEIQSTTSSQIEIEDDGTVMIFAKNGESAKEAESWIRRLIKEVEVGATYTGTVRKIAEFGIFVEIFPGKDGLIHISTIAKNKQRNLDQYVKNYDKLEVVVTAVDADTGRVRLVCPALEKAD